MVGNDKDVAHPTWLRNLQINLHRRGAEYAEYAEYAEKKRKANYLSFFSCERSTPHEQFRALRVTGRGAPHARAA